MLKVMELMFVMPSPEHTTLVVNAGMLTVIEKAGGHKARLGEAGESFLAASVTWGRSHLNRLQYLQGG